MRILNFAFLFLIIHFIGCSYYGSISNDSVNIKFPIKLASAELNHLGNNWSIDSTFAGDDHGFAFILKNDSVRFFSINDLKFSGLYSVSLVFFYDDWCELQDDGYMFYKLYLDVLDSSFESIYDSLRLQNILLVPDPVDELDHFYDMDNKIRYNITPEYQSIVFEGLEFLRYRVQNDFRQFIK